MHSLAASVDKSLHSNLHGLKDAFRRRARSVYGSLVATVGFGHPDTLVEPLNRLNCSNIVIVATANAVTCVLDWKIMTYFDNCLAFAID